MWVIKDEHSPDEVACRCFSDSRCILRKVWTISVSYTTTLSPTMARMNMAANAQNNWLSKCALLGSVNCIIFWYEYAVTTIRFELSLHKYWTINDL